MAGIIMTTTLFAQKIAYTEPDRDDARDVNFEIIGRLQGNNIIYKNSRGNYTLSVYDNDMKLIGKKKLDFLPDKLINTDFISYPDHFVMIYQYQQKNVVYCMGVNFNSNADTIGNPVEMDTTEINYGARKLYTVINSENKQKILAFKINNKRNDMHVVTTALFDANLKLIKKSALNIAMPEKNDFLTEFAVDNEGDAAFLSASSTSGNDNINKLVLFTKPAMYDDVNFTAVPLENVYLDDVRLKVDNVNRNYLVTSFYSKQKRKDIDGLYCALWHKNNGTFSNQTLSAFGTELREDARGDNSVKAAFNDNFLQSIVMKMDGGYIVTSEAAYTSTRNNGFNRWDYMGGGSFGSPYWYGGGLGSYYSFSPYSNYYYPWNRYGYGGSGFGSVTRYFADNITVMSFDSTGKMEWANVIHKSQYDDNTDNMIGYSTITTSGEVHFLFNTHEKRRLLITDQTIAPDGQINRTPTLRNLDRGYEFMPRYGKQVGARTTIIPCQYRNYLCFAKIEF